MSRVIVFTAILTTLLYALPVCALDLGDSCDFTSVTDPVSDSDFGTMQDNLAQSEALLAISRNLLSISFDQLNAPETANISYINAMLRLSDDIGKMADRIGEMADRIVATEIQIGIMADRILETQRLQNQNVALTQANLLKAQENFNNLLIQLSQ